MTTAPGGRRRHGLARLPLGLAAGGQAGVENVLDILRSGVDSALLGLRRASARELTASDAVVPPGFARALGVPGGSERELEAVGG